MEEKKEEKSNASQKIFIVRVRGRVRLRKEVQDTLTMLRLYKTNYCVIFKDTPVIMGMVKKVKDYVTWGQADEKTMNELFERCGREYKGPLTDRKNKINYKNRYHKHDGKLYNKFFKLNPPAKGYGRKGIKTQFSQKGALGYRGEKINDLIKQMMG